jgi:hypothetical protein
MKTSFITTEEVRTFAAMALIGAFTPILLGLGFESLNFSGCHQTNCFRARTGEQMSKLLWKK